LAPCLVISGGLAPSRPEKAWSFGVPTLRGFDFVERFGGSKNGVFVPPLSDWISERPGARSAGRRRQSATALDTLCRRSGQSCKETLLLDLSTAQKAKMRLGHRVQEHRVHLGDLTLCFLVRQDPRIRFRHGHGGLVCRLGLARLVG